MKPEIKEKWVAALRSGNYKKAKGCLNDGKGKMCCLGVLDDIYIKETGKGKWEPIINILDVKRKGMTFTDSSNQTCAGLLTDDVVKWAGLVSSNPCIDSIVLSDYNDGNVRSLSSLSFKKIATLIEENL